MSAHPSWCERHDDEFHQGPQVLIGDAIVQLNQMPGEQPKVYLNIGREGADLSQQDAVAIANALREAVSWSYATEMDGRE